MLRAEHPTRTLEAQKLQRFPNPAVFHSDLREIVQSHHTTFPLSFLLQTP